MFEGRLVTTMGLGKRRTNRRGLARWQEKESSGVQMTLSPDGKTVASGSQDESEIMGRRDWKGRHKMDRA